MRTTCLYFATLFFVIPFLGMAQLQNIPENDAPWVNPFPNGEMGKTYITAPTDIPDGQKLFEVKKNSIEVLYDWKGQKAPFGTITTTKKYSFYNLELEYKWGERNFEPRLEAKRDAGIIFHIKGENVVWPTCLECQIQEGDTGDLWVIKGHQVTWINKDGSEKLIDSGIKPHFLEGDKYANYELEGWNKIRVEVRGAEGAKFYENGHLVNEIKDLLDSDGNPLTKGNIALQAEGSEITYRNIRLQEILINNEMAIL